MIGVKRKASVASEWLISWVAQQQRHLNNTDQEGEGGIQRKLDAAEDREQEEFLSVGVLDVRSLQDFVGGFLAFSASIPFAQLQERANELSPRKSKIFVLSDKDSEIEETRSFLKIREYFVVGSLNLSSQAKEEFMQANCWIQKPLHQIFSHHRQTLTEEEGGNQTPKNLRHCFASVLWKPSPCLLHYIDHIESNLPAASPKLAFDIACGSGRDAVFLALRGWKVLAIDNLAIQLVRIKKLASCYGIRCEIIIPQDLEQKISKEEFREVEEQMRGFSTCAQDEETQPVSIFALYRDLEKEGLPRHSRDYEASLASRLFGSLVHPSSPIQDSVEVAFDLITVARYLHRPHLPLLPDLLRDGGFVCYHTFMRGCEVFGRPRRPHFLLQNGELGGIFESAARETKDGNERVEFEIVSDRVLPISDGRPTSFFVSQKHVFRRK